MKLVLVLLFVIGGSMAIAEEVNTDCPWSNQDDRTAVTKTKSSTTASKPKSSTVRSE